MIFWLLLAVPGFQCGCLDCKCNPFHISDLNWQFSTGENGPHEVSKTRCFSLGFCALGGVGFLGRPKWRFNNLNWFSDSSLLQHVRVCYLQVQFSSHSVETDVWSFTESSCVARWLRPKGAINSGLDTFCNLWQFGLLFFSLKGL